MAIPKTRSELLDQLKTSFQKLTAELDGAGEGVASLTAVDSWTVKDLLAVRAWWTERVGDWIVAGRQGESLVTPEAGYKWNETPRLNDDIVSGAAKESYQKVRRRLEAGFERILSLIDQLNDAELLEVGVYEWADKWPVSRWISINTVRQYTTARTKIRAALRSR